jgi:hypothetical protein
VLLLLCEDRAIPHGAAERCSVEIRAVVTQFDSRFSVARRMNVIRMGRNESDSLPLDAKDTSAQKKPQANSRLYVRRMRAELLIATLQGVQLATR